MRLITLDYNIYELDGHVYEERTDQQLPDELLPIVGEMGTAELKFTFDVSGSYDRLTGGDTYTFELVWTTCNRQTLPMGLGIRCSRIVEDYKCYDAVMD